MSSRRNVVHAKSHRPIPKASIRKRRNIDFPKFQFGRKNRPTRLFTFPEKKNWVEKESSDRNPILQNEGFNQFPFFLSCSNICIVISKVDQPTLTLFGFGCFLLGRQINLGPRSHGILIKMVPCGEKRPKLWSS